MRIYAKIFCKIKKNTIFAREKCVYTQKSFHTMIIERNSYLNKLTNHRHNGMIKVITGIRRSGKSFLLFRLFKKFLTDEGIDDEHILPFTGNVEWKDAMHGLALAGFEGLFNFELNTSRLPVSMRKIYAAYVVESAKELMSYIE